MSERRHVLIIGGGIGGLSTALALLRAGFTVDVFEQAPTLGEIGAGLTIAPNASKALQSLGLGEALADAGSIPDTTLSLYYKDGSVLQQRDLAEGGKYGAAYYHVHRADLHEMLRQAVEAMAPGCIHLAKELVGLDQSGKGVTARFADGTTRSGDLLVGADGVRSATRKILFGEEHPEFTGRIAWRAVLTADRFAHLDLPARMGSLPGPGATVAWYKMRRDSVLNLVFLAEWNTWVDEDWRARADIAEVRGPYVGWCPLVHQLIDALPPEGVMRWGLFDRPPREQWTVGRVTLLGDAIHPMLPYLGQGAAMAIEDAVTLARALAASTDVETGLAVYADSRRTRTAFLQNGSRERAQLWEKTDQRQLSSNPSLLAVQEKIFGFNAATEPLVMAT